MPLPEHSPTTPPPDSITTLLRRDTMGGYWQMANFDGAEWHMLRYSASGDVETVLIVHGDVIQIKDRGFLVPGYG